MFLLATASWPDHALDNPCSRKAGQYSFPEDAMRIGRALAACVAGLLVTIPFTSAFAQSPSPSWPQRPVKFIVSLGPGSGADIGARLLAERLTTRWNQPVVVENRPGGDAVVAINAFIGARDDHTLLYTPTSSFTAHPYQLDKMPYDPRELSPVTRISNTLVGLVVPASLNVKSVADLVAMIKAQPGKLNYSTATGMTDVIYEGYFKSAGLQITRVPYRDVVAPLTDLGEGRIQAYVGALAIVQPHVQAGRVKLIAVTNTQRAPNYPDMPTVAQAGFPDITFDGLIGLFGPKDMAAPARERIAADVRAVLGEEAVKARFVATSQLISPGTSTEFAASIEEQRKKLAAIAQKLGVKVAQ
jgi:tripartite-type tricarboxylate transporter receptor subunit TctC